MALFSKTTVKAVTAQAAGAVADLEGGRATDGHTAFMAPLTLGTRDLR